ncbi:hypothetical protein X559_3264 [Paenilisteria newyorkensis]|nr:hypothetical protein X559_3264 [Listeria newyorkensis]
MRLLCVFGKSLKTKTERTFASGCVAQKKINIFLVSGISL